MKKVIAFGTTFLYEKGNGLVFVVIPWWSSTPTENVVLVMMRLATLLCIGAQLVMMPICVCGQLESVGSYIEIVCQGSRKTQRLSRTVLTHLSIAAQAR